MASGFSRRRLRLDLRGSAGEIPEEIPSRASWTTKNVGNDGAGDDDDDAVYCSAAAAAAAAETGIAEEEEAEGKLFGSERRRADYCRCRCRP